MSCKRLYYDSMLKWKVTGIQKGMETEQQAMNLILGKKTLMTEELKRFSQFFSEVTNSFSRKIPTQVYKAVLQCATKIYTQKTIASLRPSKENSIIKMCRVVIRNLEEKSKRQKWGLLRNATSPTLLMLQDNIE